MKRIFIYLLISITLLCLIQPSVSSASPVPTILDAGTGRDNNLLKERIYIHTDREIYIAGEYLFFKVYLYDEGEKKLSLNSKFAYILITNRDKQITQLCLPITGGIGYGSLSLPDTLRTGPYQVIAYTNWMRNFGESCFFRKQLLIVNRFDENLTSVTQAVTYGNEWKQKQEKSTGLKISTARISYHQHEKVILNLSLQGSRNANVSISVVEKPPDNINHTDRLKAFSASDTINTLMNISRKDDLKMCNYLLEDKGYIISGYVQNPLSRAGILVRLSTPDTTDNLMYSTTNESGRFFFQLNDFYYNKDLYISIPDQIKEPESDLILEDKYVFHNDHNLTDTTTFNQYVPFIKKCQTIASINRAYNIQPVRNVPGSARHSVSRSISGKPDYKILLADYVPLKDFYEIVRETLPYVRLRKNKNNYEVEILDRENKIFMKNPAVFLNGMLINNIDNMVSFGSDKIRRIETVCHTRVSGSMVFNGILSVFTSPDVKNNLFFDKHSMHLPPISLINHSYYTNPDYSDPEKKINRYPDFRQLLYWNPSLDLSGNQNIHAEFYTSDSKGTYIIKVEGIASDGNPMSCEANFDVR